MTAFEVDVFSGDARLLVELDVKGRLVIDQNWCFEVEVKKHDQLVTSTGLIEQMLHI